MLEKFKVPSSSSPFHIPLISPKKQARKKENQNRGANARRYEQENNTNNNNKKSSPKHGQLSSKTAVCFLQLLVPFFPAPFNRKITKGEVTFKNEVHYTPSIPPLEPALNDKRYEGMRNTSILD